MPENENKNEYEYKIPLKNKFKEIIAYAIVDKNDFEQLNKYKWCMCSGYAFTQLLGKMHRHLLSANVGSTIDHINGNKLDNRKINLRFSTVSQNSQNVKKRENCTSKYIGVRLDNGRWRCNIRINKKQISFTFKKEEHSAYWYDTLALEHYGTHAKINGIVKPYDFKEPIKTLRTIKIVKKKYNNIENIERNNEELL